MSLTSRDHWREMNPIRESINSFFDDLFTRRLPSIPCWGEWKPSIDLMDNGADYIILADLPGYAPDNVKITVQENSITLGGKVQEEKEANESNFQVKERSFGTFSRTIPLPAQIKPDEASAKFKHGVLRVTLPKVEVPVGRILDIELE